MEREQHLVSIIMPSYNAERFILDSINSVRNQTYQDWELLITDDQSKDNTYAIIKSVAEEDPRIRIFRLDVNSGAAVARNSSISQAKGRYIAFLDSDDLWLPDKLEKQLDFMQRDKIGFSFTAYYVLDDQLRDSYIVYAPKMITYKEYLFNTIIGCLTVMVDREITGDFRMPLIRKNQDMATWLSLLKKGHNGYGLDIPLSRYRIVEGSISNDKIKAAKSVWKVYREVEKLSILQSIYYLMGYAWNAVKKRMTNRL